MRRMEDPLTVSWQIWGVQQATLWWVFRTGLRPHVMAYMTRWQTVGLRLIAIDR